jgi:hypothetical protein
MSTRDSRPISATEAAGGAPTDQGINSPNWDGLHVGAAVIDAKGERIGTVLEAMPHYLTVEMPENALVTVELYVPRKLVARVVGSAVHLNRTAEELKQLDLKTPPALRES